METTFSDRQANRDRSCKYGVFYKGEMFTKLQAEESNLAVFQKMDYVKNGKWSYTTWLVTTGSATLVVANSPFNGWPDSLDDCVKEIKSSHADRTSGGVITDEVALVFFGWAYPKSYARIYDKERSLSKLF